MEAVTRERIDGFSSLGEFGRFVAAVEAKVSSGALDELPAEPHYGPDFIYGGRWFKDTASGLVWRLVAPDYPYKGVWEPVRF